jgi:hypothetical protein
MARRVERRGAGADDRNTEGFAHRRGS